MKRFLISAAIAFLVIGTCLLTACSKKPQPGEETPDKVPARPASPSANRGTMPATPPRAAPATTPATAPAHAHDAATQSAAPGTQPAAAPPVQLAPLPEMAEMRKKFGLEVIDVVSSGPLINVQLMIFEPEKTGPVLSPAAERYLIDQKTGTRLSEGSQRATAGQRRLVPGGGALRQPHMASFDNSKGLVKPGDTVSLVIDDYRIDGLVVR